MKTFFFILMLLVSINFTNAQNRSAIEIGTGKIILDKDLAKNLKLSNPWTFNFRYIYTSLPTGDIHVNAGFKSFSLSREAENQTYKKNYMLLLAGITYFHNLIEPDVYYLQAMGGYQYTTNGEDSKFHQLNIGISGGIDKLRLNLYYSYSLSGYINYDYRDQVTNTDIAYKYRISSINLTLTYLFGH